VTPKLHHILGLNNKVAEGSIMVNCSWIWAGEDPGRMDAHAHPYAEVIGFAGATPRTRMIWARKPRCGWMMKSIS